MKPRRTLFTKISYTKLLRISVEAKVLLQMIKDVDSAILLISLVIWLTPFFHLMNEEPEDVKWVKKRQETELHLILAGIGILLAAGLCGWGALLYKLGLTDDPFQNWKTAVPLFSIAAISPTYSFIKWYRLQ